jgi:hypothetical protein
MRQKIKTICLPLILFFLLFSCAPIARLARPLPENVQQNFNTFAVVSQSSKPSFHHAKPMTDKDKACSIVAGRFAGEWAAGCLLAAPETLFLSLFLLPGVVVAAPVGCIVGLVETPSEVKVQEAEAILNETIAGLNFQETMRYDFLKIAQTTMPHKTFIAFDVADTENLKEELKNSTLVSKGINKVLEISITEIQLRGLAKDKYDDFLGNSRLKLFLSLHIRLTHITLGSSPENKIVREYIIYHDSPVKSCGKAEKYFNWVADDGMLLKERISTCCQSIAEQIVADLFEIGDLKED